MFYVFRVRDYLCLFYVYVMQEGGDFDFFDVDYDGNKDVVDINVMLVFLFLVMVFVFLLVLYYFMLQWFLILLVIFFCIGGFEVLCLFL